MCLFFWRKKVNVSISLENPMATPGNTIKGTVKAIAPKKTVKIENIRLRFEGYYTYHFDTKMRIYEKNLEQQGYPRPRIVTRTIRDTTKLVNQELILTGKRELVSGKEYTFNFELQVPPELPPSYFGALAEINYVIEAIVGLKWAPDKIARAKIVLRDLRDCNQNIELPQVVDGNNVTVVIPQCVASGEVLNGKLIIIPQENKEYSGIRVELIKREKVAPTNLPRGEIVEIMNTYTQQLYKAKITKDLNLVATVKKEINFSVPIPQGEATIRYSNLSVEHFLKITFEKRWAFDKSMEIPITII